MYTLLVFMHNNLLIPIIYSNNPDKSGEVFHIISTLHHLLLDYSKNIDSIIN